MDDRGQALVAVSALAMLLVIGMLFGVMQPHLLDLVDDAEDANNSGTVGDSHDWFRTMLHNWRLGLVMLAMFALVAAGLAQGSIG